MIPRSPNESTFGDQFQFRGIHVLSHFYVSHVPKNFRFFEINMYIKSAICVVTGTNAKTAKGLIQFFGWSSKTFATACDPLKRFRFSSFPMMYQTFEFAWTSLIPMSSKSMDWLGVFTHSPGKCRSSQLADAWQNAQFPSVTSCGRMVLQHPLIENLTSYTPNKSLHAREDSNLQPTG